MHMYEGGGGKARELVLPTAIGSIWPALELHSLVLHVYVKPVITSDIRSQWGRFDEHSVPEL